MSEKDKDKGIIKESANKVKDFINEKLSSPFWVSFIVAWLICNWKFWYVTFFIDEKLLMESEHKLKTSYIESFYSKNYHDFNFIYFYKDFIYPLVISLFIYFVMSYLVDLFHWKTEKDRKSRTLRVFETNKKIEDEKEELLSDTLIKKQSNTEKEKSIKEIDKKSKTQEEIWDEEYNNFKQTEYFNKFEEIKNCIYSNYGKTDKFDNYSVERVDIVSVNVKSYFSVNKIIEIYFSPEERIKLTEKGNYFMRKFLDEQKKEIQQ